ncbi:MAG: DUF1638 domain-containing protein [Candidatus Methanoplasma sp.]|jgi:hypothetical protein|nr:DUF1638 domain-containing protein [Candidatus Methanoplasma sp.]
MTRGTLGAIVCPILEDELVYNLSTDPEEKRVFLLESENSQDISAKLRSRGIEFTLLDERSFLNGTEPIPDDGYNVVVLMKGLGLHSEPEILKADLRETLLFMQSKVDAFVLYYGLCGNANKGIEEWAKERLDKPVSIFKGSDGRLCDDCIGVAVGGTDRYYELQKKHTGVLYYTPAMSTKWRGFFGQNDLFKGVESANFDRMKAVLEMCDYHNVMEIPTGLGDDAETKRSLEEFAKEFKFNVSRLEPGWTSLEPTKRIYAEAKASLSATRC